MFIELPPDAHEYELRRASESDDGDNDGYRSLELPASGHGELRRASKSDDGDHDGDRAATLSYDHRCDVYSFGIVLWELMHEERPFWALDARETRAATRRVRRPPMHLAAERARFGPLIKACWAHEPEQRPEFAALRRELREELRREGERRHGSQELRVVLEEAHEGSSDELLGI